jgi:hypothetical protein
MFQKRNLVIRRYERLEIVDYILPAMIILWRHLQQVAEQYTGNIIAEDLLQQFTFKTQEVLANEVSIKEDVNSPIF